MCDTRDAKPQPTKAGIRTPWALFAAHLPILITAQEQSSGRNTHPNPLERADASVSPRPDRGPGPRPRRNPLTNSLNPPPPKEVCVPAPLVKGENRIKAVTVAEMVKTLDGLICTHGS